MSFTDDIRKFRLAAGKAGEKTLRAVTLEAFGSVIADTPVDTGRARGAWQTNIGAPKTGEIERLDKSGASAKSEVAANLPKLGQQVFLSNNLPYIEALEYGSSSQSPSGMVRKNYARITRILEQQVAKHRLR